VNFFLVTKKGEEVHFVKGDDYIENLLLAAKLTEKKDQVAQRLFMKAYEVFFSLQRLLAA